MIATSRPWPQHPQPQPARALRGCPPVVPPYL